MSDRDKIIGLEEGYKIVKEQGIDPFIQMIENSGKDGKMVATMSADHYISIYDVVFKMCIQREPHNFSDQLYNRYCAALTNWNKQHVKAMLTNAHRTHDIGFLTEWNQRWTNHKRILEGIARLFTYLDRFHTANNDAILPLREKGDAIYKDCVFDAFAGKAAEAILRCIEKERNEEDVDRNLLHQAVLAFVEMGTRHGTAKLSIYRNQLERKITEGASTFYKRTSRSWMTQDSTPNYLKKAEKMLAQEKARVEAYLNRVTMDPLKQACYTELLHNHQIALLDKKTGIGHMLATSSMDDLSRLFRLFKHQPADLDPISQRFHDHIKAEGIRIVSESQAEGANRNDPNNGLVARLISLHDQYEVIVTTCFEQHHLFQKSLKRAFESFINEDEKVSNLLAHYTHEVLRKGSSVNVSSVNLEGVLSNIAYLYLYIQDKDVFERSYQFFLRNRLLQNDTENEYSEKHMIHKLKHGNFQWTNKLEGMFKDIQLSKELQQRFLAAEGKHIDEKKHGRVEVNVCTMANWPRAQNTYRANLPQELTPLQDGYTAFYDREHKGHMLEWRLEQGNAEVVVKFNTRTAHTLVCSTYQMMLLLLFNKARFEDNYTISYSTILNLIGLPGYVIGHHLLSMCHPDLCTVLQKNPNSPSLEDSDKYRVNPKYTNRSRKVTVPTMTPPEVNDREEAEAKRAIERMRKNWMQAAVVRIMKSSKRMKHKPLVNDVITQLSHRFRPTPTQIKRTIEELISQEYLERDENDRGTYKYLA